MKKPWFLLGFSLSAALGLALVLISTRLGAFLTDDSYHYIKPARDFLAGLGFTPSTIFPPMLPVALIPMGWLGIEPLQGIRLLNAALFGINAIFAALLVVRLGGSRSFALLAAFLVALSENLIAVHAGGMSDALAISLSLGAMLLILRYLKQPRWFWLISCAALIGLALVTRFAALPILAAVALTLLVARYTTSWLHRLRDIALLTLVSLTPLGMYMLRNLTILDRPLYYPGTAAKPLTLENLNWYLYNTLSWFIPGRFLREREQLVSFVLLCLLGLAGFYLWRRYRQLPRDKQFPVWNDALLLCISTIVLNYLMLYFARNLQALAVYNIRYLAPPLLVFLIVLVYFLDRLWRFPARQVRGIVLIVSLVLLVYYSLRSFDYVSEVSQTGSGYLNRGWHNSETVTYLLANPDRTVVATGDVGIYFWTGRLPRSLSSFSNMAEMRQYLCQNDGLLVIMNQLPINLYRLEEREVIRDLLLAHDFRDSRVYICQVD